VKEGKKVGHENTLSHYLLYISVSDIGVAFEISVVVLALSSMITMM
jgi:hypothetical protein